MDKITALVTLTEQQEYKPFFQHRLVLETAVTTEESDEGSSFTIVLTDEHLKHMKIDKEELKSNPYMLADFEREYIQKFAPDDTLETLLTTNLECIVGSLTCTLSPTPGIDAQRVMQALFRVYNENTEGKYSETVDALSQARIAIRELRYAANQDEAANAIPLLINLLEKEEIPDDMELEAVETLVALRNIKLPERELVRLNNVVLFSARVGLDESAEDNPVISRLKKVLPQITTAQETLVQRLSETAGTAGSLETSLAVPPKRVSFKDIPETPAQPVSLVSKTPTQLPLSTPKPAEKVLSPQTEKIIIDIIKELAGTGKT